MLAKLAKYKLQLLLAVWLVAMLLALQFQAKNQLSEFDPENKLLKLTQASTQGNELNKILAKIVAEYKTDVIGTAGTVLHFSTDNCFCYTLSQPHIQSVRQLSELHGYTNIEINLTKNKVNAKLWQLIPSVPAIAVINDEKQLIYFGPYSSGYNCSPDNGLAEPFITTKQPHQLTTIASQEKGCYCNLAP
ncbi:hypothetical protein C2869_12850 [Saccharobesus litoralis]|uniref:DUF6436 domain-containing protein n=1 Tax=Saccharobesus litoralis TaxID=2172099 RepID=A0A2S0VST4_9ALTE|nr:DUF6436 domain-containing protein [Saccharobesus litoralis]AWB67274.1 hypothetical protein C2869_12850 [Saccharobesus litoralis]